MGYINISTEFIISTFNPNSAENECGNIAMFFRTEILKFDQLCLQSWKRFLFGKAFCPPEFSEAEVFSPKNYID